ncbi:MAG TPA: hypothetical protein PKA17_02180, partial [Phenylobacterium sp.]|nr:hypothetical protein [Phenylobacterium sp.]
PSCSGCAECGFVLDQAMRSRFGEDNPAVRREAALSLIAQSDALCEHYLVGVSERRNQVRAGLSVTSLLLNTLSGVLKPISTSAALTAAGTFSQGASTSIENTVMGGNEYRLIYTAVKNGRQERRRILYADINGGQFDTWSADSIVAYLTPYHLDCGLNYALERLDAATSALGSREPDPPPVARQLPNDGPGPATVPESTPEAAPDGMRAPPS